MLETGEAAVERGRIILDDCSNHVEIADRDGGKDVVPRAARHQEIGDRANVFARFGEEGSPADYVAGMIGAEAMHVAASVEQQSHDGTSPRAAAQ